MYLKMPKWFLRFPGSCGTYHTLQEKKKNSDPDMVEYVRAKRKSKNLVDGYSNTKWIRKINDKSWKTRCKKRHQYDKHRMTPKEMNFCIDKINEYKSKIRSVSESRFNDYEKIKLMFGNKNIFDEAMNEMLRDGEVVFEWRSDEELSGIKPANTCCKRKFYYHILKKPCSMLY